MRKPRPQLVTVAVITTITIVFWIFYSVYSILTTRTPLSEDAQLLSPLNPTLDGQFLSQIENKIFFEEGDTTSLVTVDVFIPSPQEPDETPLEEEEVVTEEGEEQPASQAEEGEQEEL